MDNNLQSGAPIPEGAQVGNQNVSLSVGSAIPAGAKIGEINKPEINPQSNSSGFNQAENSVGKWFGDTLHNAVEGFGETASGLGRQLYKIASPVIDPLMKDFGYGHISDEAAKEATKPNLTGDTSSKFVGYGGETLLEFLAGDAAIAKLPTMAMKLEAITKVTKALESSPKLMAALKVGANALKQGTVAGGQEFVRSDDVESALKQGGTMAAVAAALHVPVSVFQNVIKNSGEAGLTLLKLFEEGKNNIPPKETVGNVAGMLADAEQNVHNTYENMIQNVRKEASNTKYFERSGPSIPVVGSPLQKAASEAVEGRLGSNLTPEELKALRSNVNHPVLNLFAKPEGKNIPNLDIDRLIELRQEVGKTIRDLPYGEPNARALRIFRDGIDDTIEQLGQKTNPQIASKYKAARDFYRDNIKYFDTSKPEGKLLKNLTDGNINDVGRELTAGSKSVDKIRFLRQAIGEDNMKNVSDSIIKNWMHTASIDEAGNDLGKIDIDKFIRQIPKNEQLLNELFGDLKSPAREVLTDAKNARKVQKLVSRGMLALTGAATGATIGESRSGHYGGLAGALIGLATMGGGSYLGRQMLDELVSNPKFVNATINANKAINSTTAKTVGKSATYGLSKVLSGAAGPLGGN